MEVEQLSIGRDFNLLSAINNSNDVLYKQLGLLISEMHSKVQLRARDGQYAEQAVGNGGLYSPPEGGADVKIVLLAISNILLMIFAIITALKN